MKRLFSLLSLFLFAFHAEAAPRRVLVVLSSSDKITLRDGVTHPTGFFLNELTVPLKALLDAGFEPVFANPLGNEPVMDKLSDSPDFFGGDKNKPEEMKKLLASLPGFRHPLRLAEARRQGPAEFAALFVPGGHAPMEDLYRDRDLGALLAAFHKASKPTALICHGPIALLSALSDPAGFADKLAQGKPTERVDWIYRGYAMTSFSTAEEKEEEPGKANALGGFVRFYPDFALAAAGAKIRVAEKWQSHVVRDRELITGQNPSSDREFVEALLKALKSSQQK